MRVISGKYRGMNLAQFKGAEIRPTADRVKESLFNIISARVAGASVLDLFCGSGSIGVECLSRGAERVHFNDAAKDSIAVLKKNLSRLDGNGFTVSCSDFKQCLSRERGFDFIFIDPPYKTGYGAEALKIIAEGNILNGDGIAVLESDKIFSGEIAGLKMYDERKYGITVLSFFKKAE